MGTLVKNVLAEQIYQSVFSGELNMLFMEAMYDRDNVDFTTRAEFKHLIRDRLAPTVEQAVQSVLKAHSLSDRIGQAQSSLDSFRSELLGILTADNAQLKAQMYLPSTHNGEIQDAVELEYSEIVHDFDRIFGCLKEAVAKYKQVVKKHYRSVLAKLLENTVYQPVFDALYNSALNNRFQFISQDGSVDYFVIYKLLLAMGKGVQLPRFSVKAEFDLFNFENKEPSKLYVLI